jgi:hypothetical protein
MNIIKKKHMFGLLIIFTCVRHEVNAQVLISLLFGDALNSEKVEFGLVGGGNRSWIPENEESNGLNSFNLGFYFHINMKGNTYLSTGVLVKSNVGARGMSVYPIGDQEFDDVFATGELTKKIHYFYVPILWHQRFSNRWYLEGGIQLGLRNKAKDIFNLQAYDGDLSYTRDVRDEYRHLDAGLLGGVGYKFKKETKSISMGVNYFYGLVNVSLTDQKIKNSSMYLYLKIPIGAGGKEKKDKESGS